MTLDERIEQLLDAGHADPHVVARFLIQQADEGWLVEELHAIAAQTIATRARFAIHRRRGTSGARDLRTNPAMVPARDNAWNVNGNWKPEAELTAWDCRWIAERYDRLAQSMAASAEKFRRYAELMEDAGVVRLGDLGAEIRKAA